MNAKYDGGDRRVQDHRDPVIICKQEDKINDMSDSVHRTESAVERLDLRINGTLEKMATHVEDSTYWRRFIVGTAISLVLAIIGGMSALFTLSYNLGQYARQISINTLRLSTIEDMARTLHHKDNGVQNEKKAD